VTSTVTCVRRALLALLVLLVAAPAAHAASRQIIRGAGFGHGIGMSQYGAYGYARHGVGYGQILTHYYKGTDLSKVDPGQTVRVLLQSGAKTATFTGATKAPGHDLDESKTYQVRLAGLSGEDLIGPNGKQIDHYDGPLDITSSTGVVQLGGTALNGVKNGHYRDTMEFRTSTFGGLAVINDALLDDYVKGVVPGEIPAAWPAAALQAQAVAARTYALATDAGGSQFDQYPDTRSQMYVGFDGEQARSSDAVDATANQVLRYQGKIAVTYFFSTSGGETEDVQNVFYGAAPAPYLVGVKDPYDNVSPRHRWRMTMTTKSMQRKLGSLVKGRFKGIKVLKRGVSPRIVWAAVVGTRGSTQVRGATLEAKLGLFDTWASFNRFTGKVRVPPTETAPPISPGGGVPGTTTGVYHPPAHVKQASKLVGTISPAPRKTLVALQREGADGRWRTVHHLRLRRNGGYSVAVSTPGTYRVVAGPLDGPPLAVG
jgi:stage II sporulation protein D